MNLTRSLVFLFTMLVFLPTVSAQEKNINLAGEELYKQAGTIRILDPLALEVGSRQDGQNVFEIDLPSLQTYTGHVCGGVASAFLMTRKALALLFPKEIPNRGVLKVSASKPGCLLDPIMLITGTRAPLKGQTGDHTAIEIDPKLHDKEENVVVRFERTDTKKAVEAVFSKKRMLKNVKDKKRFMKLKSKVEAHTATSEERKAFGAMVQEIVRGLIQGEFSSFTFKTIQ